MGAGSDDDSPNFTESRASRNVRSALARRCDFEQDTTTRRLASEGRTLAVYMQGPAMALSLGHDGAAYSEVLPLSTTTKEDAPCFAW